jgi:hypothetical protein
MPEDPQMMAFFDSLVQREREGLASDSDDSSDDDLICTGIESSEDTDYASLSDDSGECLFSTDCETLCSNVTRAYGLLCIVAVPNQNSVLMTSGERSSGEFSAFSS